MLKTVHRKCMVDEEVRGENNREGKPQKFNFLVTEPLRRGGGVKGRNSILKKMLKRENSNIFVWSATLTWRTTDRENLRSFTFR